MPCRGGIRQVDSDLGVVNLAGGAGVLARHPHGVGAFLEVARLVNHQHRARVTQVLDQPVADIVADGIVVPHRPGQQVLHSIRAGVPGMLGDRPAVLARQVRQQPQHERAGAPSGLHPGKPAGDPAQ